MKTITEKLGLEGIITIKHFLEIEEIIQVEIENEKERIIKIISLTGGFSIKDGREKFASEFKKDIISKIKELK